jgi:hypothetical protein
MGVLRHRPRIRLRLYPEVYPGEVVDVAVILDARREVTVDSIDVLFRGYERVLAGRAWQTNNLIQRGLRLSGRRALPRGRSELPCRLELPRELPPAYEGRMACTRYELSVRVAIPWWLDRQELFRVRLIAPPATAEPEQPERLPTRFATRRGGPRGTEPYMEGSLATTNIEPGAILSGAVALSNTAYNRYQGVFVSLVAREAVSTDWGPSEVEVKRFELRLEAEVPREGQPVPFHLAVPTGLHPSFRSELLELKWYVEVRAEIGWRSDLVFLVPAWVLPSRSRREALGPQIQVPPSVGSPRVQELWRTVAAETGLSVTDEGMWGVVAGVQLEIRREHRGRGGIFLVGELRYPSLGIGLRLRPATGLQRRLGGGLSLGDPAWDRNHQLQGREEGQVLAFGKQILSALWAFRRVEMDDTRALVEQRGAGQDRRALKSFTVNVRQLAEALSRARGQIPPPELFAAVVPAWEQLAERLQGTLDCASMSVTGGVHGMPATVCTVWSEAGEPHHTRIELHPSFPLPERYAVTLSSEGGRIALPAALPIQKEALELLEAAVDGALSFRLAGSLVEVQLPGPLLDPRPLVADRIETLVRLCVALGRGGGPYR